MCGKAKLATLGCSPWRRRDEIRSISIAQPAAQVHSLCTRLQLTPVSSGAAFLSTYDTPEDIFVVSRVRCAWFCSVKEKRRRRWKWNGSKTDGKKEGTVYMLHNSSDQSTIGHTDNSWVNLSMACDGILCWLRILVKTIFLDGSVSGIKLYFYWTVCTLVKWKLLRAFQSNCGHSWSNVLLYKKKKIDTNIRYSYVQIYSNLISYETGYLWYIYTYTISQTTYSHLSSSSLVFLPFKFQDILILF